MEIARIRTVTGGYQGAPGVTTCYMRKNTTSAWSAIAGQLTTQVKDAWDEWIGYEPVPWTYSVQADMDILDDETGQIQYTVTGTERNGVGTATGGFAPSATGVLVRLHTAGVNAGSRVKGGVYLVPCGYSNAFDDDGTPTSGLLTAAGAFGTQLADAQYGKLVVWSRPKSTNAVGSSYDVDSVTVKDTFAILRSRRD